MCLIIAKPQKIAYNAKKINEYIKKGYAVNRDGLGFAYKKRSQNSVTIRRGFKSAEDIIDTLDSLKFSKDDELIIHLRMGTCGEKSIINNHPFPITKDVNLLTKEEIITSVGAFAHNGIMNPFSYSNSKYCDSYNFVRDFLFETTTKDDNTKDFCYNVLYDIRQECKTLKGFYDVIDKMPLFGSNRFAFLTGRGLLVTGDWWRDNHGILLSTKASDSAKKYYEQWK